MIWYNLFLAIFLNLLATALFRRLNKVKVNTSESLMLGVKYSWPNSVIQVSCCLELHQLVLKDKYIKYNCPCKLDKFLFWSFQCLYFGACHYLVGTIIMYIFGTFFGGASEWL